MIVYKVVHKYKLQKHTELKNIGVYSSYDLAKNAIEPKVITPTVAKIVLLFGD